MYSGPLRGREKKSLDRTWWILIEDHYCSRGVRGWTRRQYKQHLPVSFIIPDGWTGLRMSQFYEPLCFISAIILTFQRAWFSARLDSFIQSAQLFFSYSLHLYDLVRKIFQPWYDATPHALVYRIQCWNHQKYTWSKHLATNGGGEKKKKNELMQNFQRETSGGTKIIVKKKGFTLSTKHFQPPLRGTLLFFFIFD